MVLIKRIRSASKGCVVKNQKFQDGRVQWLRHCFQGTTAE
jgi:hypothetical protein